MQQTTMGWTSLEPTACSIALYFVHEMHHTRPVNVGEFGETRTKEVKGIGDFYGKMHHLFVLADTTSCQSTDHVKRKG